ncbi:unnamed protein product [Linum tenue]|uniref:Uncharacterized protein n=1 Tax=Linum tenue TaxID=586396 RepID=A0AAV0JNG1_9ROSI|nr:unnamed protein product [Linum tenue]
MTTRLYHSSKTLAAAAVSSSSSTPFVAPTRNIEICWLNCLFLQSSLNLTIFSPPSIQCEAKT